MFFKGFVIRNLWFWNHENFGFSRVRRRAGQKQASLRKFFQPQHPDALKPVKWLPKTLPLRGRPLSKETLRLIDEAVSRLDRSKAEDPVAVLEEVAAVKRKGGRPQKAGPAKASRQDIPVAPKTGMLQDMLEQEHTFADEADFFRHFAKKYDRSTPQIKSWWRSRQELTATQRKHRLSRNPVKFSAKKGVKKTSYEKRYKGFRRLQGAGRRSSFESVRQDLKNWFNEQRCLGNQVLQQDLYERYVLFLHDHVLGLESKAEGLTDPLVKGETLAAVGEGRQTLKKLESSKKYRESLTSRLKLLVGAKNLKPHLDTKLSPLEEQARVQLTWQAYDGALWTAALAPPEELGKWVSKPEQFLQSRSNLVLFYADQIPLWIKAGLERELFAEWETQPTSQEALRQKLRASLQQDQPSTDASGALVVSASEQDASGQKQLRSRKQPLSERFRVTYEARQIVMNYASTEEPVGSVYKGLLIVAGPHAVLDWIADDGTWNRDHEFVYKGKLVSRKKGRSCGRLLEPWRALRLRKPDIFKELSVYSQPSSNADGIVLSWVALELSSTFPSLLVQRDCLGASFSDSVQEAHFVGNTIQTMVGPKVTASVQLTDTDFSRKFKSLCRNEMASRRSKGQSALRSKGESTIWTCSFDDIAETILHAQRAMSQQNERDQWILRGLRRNAMLCYRPWNGALRVAEDSPH